MSDSGFIRIAALMGAVALAGAGIVGVVVRRGVQPEAAEPSGSPSIRTTRRADSLPTPSLPTPIESYETDVWTPEGMAARNRAVRNQGKQPFVGRVNGILVDPTYDPPCHNWVKMTPQQARRYAPPTPTWLPPGSRDKGTGGYMCGRRPIQAGRGWIVTEGGIEFVVVRRFGQSAVKAWVGEKRVKKGQVQGRPAVFLLPLTAGGAGNSWIAFKEGNDMIEFLAADLRFADLRRAAESLPL